MGGHAVCLGASCPEQKSYFGRQLVELGEHGSMLQLKMRFTLGVAANMRYWMLRGVSWAAKILWRWKQ